MSAKAFANVTTHLLNGRLNLMGGDKVTASLVTSEYIGTNPTYALQNTLWMSQWGEAVSPVELTPVCTLASNVMRVTLPGPIPFTSQYTGVVYGVLFYKATTGATSTWPVIALDLFPAIRLEAGLTFNYTPSPSGILTLTVVS